MSIDLFKPEKSFFSLGIVRFVFLFDIFIAMFFVWIIDSNSQLAWTFKGFDYSAANQAVIIFQVPLAVLAMLIPLIAVLAANHRSEQIREQIKVANVQNNFHNYYKHIEEFEKHCQHIKNVDGEHVIIKPRSLHRLLFNNMEDGNPEMSFELTNTIDEYIIGIFSALDSFADGTENEVEKASQNRLFNLSITGSLNQLIEKFYLADNQKVIRMYDENPFSYEKNSPYGVFVAIKGICMIVDEILSFNTNYQESLLVKKILNYSTVNLLLTPNTTLSRNSILNNTTRRPGILSLIGYENKLQTLPY